MIGQRFRKIILAGFAALSLFSTISAALAQPAPVPALPDTERRTSYSITANTCACAVNFALFGDSTDYANWVEVFLNGTRVNYNDATFGWTITSPSGSLSNLARPITDAVLTFSLPQTGTVQIVGARRPRRVSQYQEGGGVPTRNFNRDLTDIIAQNREIWDKTNDMTGRGLFSQPGNTMSPLPLPSVCANAFLSFDGTGLNPLCQQILSSGSLATPGSTVNGDFVIWTGTNGKQLGDGGTPGTFAFQNYATPPAIGGTTPNAGAFSTLSSVAAPHVNSPTGTPTALRIPLSGATTFYVNATGASAICGVNGTLTCGIGSATPANPTNPSTPFDTTQHAIDYIRQNIDARGQVVTINMAHGSSTNYGFNCLGQPLLGVVTFNVVGDYSSPTAVTVIAPNGNWAIQGLDQCVPSLSSFQITDQGSSVGGVFSEQQGIVDLRSITIGSWNTGGVPIVAIDGGKVNLLGQDPNSTITNTLAGTSYGQVFQVQNGGIIDFRGLTVAVPNGFTISATGCGGAACSMATGIGGYFTHASIATFTGAGTPSTSGSRCSYTNTFSSGINPNTIFIGNVNCTPTTSAF
jgi:hypothetical protein